MIDQPLFHRRVDDRQGSHATEGERHEGEGAELQRRTLLMVEADHDLSHDENESGVYDKGQAQASDAEVLDETFEQLKDDKKGQQAIDREAESLLEIAGEEDLPYFRQEPEETYAEHEQNEKDQVLEKEVDGLIKKRHGVESAPEFS
jgi:hypothetical protein